MKNVPNIRKKITLIYHLVYLKEIRQPTEHVHLVWYNIGVLKVGVEELIVNATLVSLQSKNTNKVKSEVRFKQVSRSAFIIDSSTPTLRKMIPDFYIVR
jgi:hypothetical protein